MFFFGKGDKDTDVDNMTMTQLMETIRDGISDPDVREAMGFDMTKAQYTKALNMIRVSVMKDPRATEITKDTLLGYKAGIIYGMAMAAKVPPKSGEKIDKTFLKKKVCQILFPFTVLDQGVDNWLDDNYLNNLLKNAKVADPKKIKND